MFKIM